MHPLMEWTRRPEYMIRRVLRYWLCNPTSPLAISSALWFSESGPGSSTINATILPPCDLSFPPESFSIEPSRASLVRVNSHNTSHGLSVPTALSSDEDPLTQAVPRSCFGPPSGFGYPLDGLRPSTPGRACFVPTALLGFTPSEHSPLRR